MKIGFYFTAQKENGGIYQYTQTILKGLVSTKHEITVFNMSKDLDASVIPGKFRVVELIGKKNPEMKKQTSVSARRKVVEIIENTLIKTHFYFLLNRLRLWRARSRAQIIDKEKMDYVFFPNISDVSVTVKTPTIICVHDLQHRISPHFPEVSKDGQFSWRELTSKRTLERASLVIAESEVGKEYIQELYGTDPKMIRTLPYLPPDYLQLQSTEALSKIKTELELPETFFFYPGQLWPHKNHINLIKALIILKNKGLNPSLVLSGARKDKWGIYEKVTTMVKENGLENQVKYLGYVDNQTIGALYQLALATRRFHPTAEALHELSNWFHHPSWLSQ